ncbi:MAG TPA: aminoacetone oxidase family FAD-binding enzyme [Candidatus Kapabacteria bacterium]|jgi:hypothetical protein|nr:aminoacetone oxidase family FAD-binding enzyme [Candidatus Kapabacteria bacterium]
MTKSIAIVGGGAGGIFAALGAMSAVREVGISVEVHLFERNPRLGIKILISGGGKCNITHAGPVETILNEGFPYTNERRFLKSAMYRYTNEDVLRLLERHGVAWHARENGRIFPDSGRAEDVLRAFEQELRAEHVIFHTKSRITSIEHSDDCWKLSTDFVEYTADALILATGGTSYRKVGTTGDGLGYAEQLGHTIVPIRAALAPIYLKRPLAQEFAGVALRDVDLYAMRDSTVLAQAHGDLLLTHRGLSGPATLDISRAAALHFEDGPINMKSNLLNTEEQSLRETLIFEQQSRAQQQVKTWLEEVLPNRFVPQVFVQSDIPIERKWHALTREERIRLLGTLLRFDFGLVSEIPIDRGEVTSGGISLAEVDSKIMMSNIVGGLFFAGEMLDVAGEIGGYNLQAAYSSGWAAGEEAVKFLVRTK